MTSHVIPVIALARRAIFALAFASALAGCNSSTSLLPEPASPDVYDAVAQTDLTAKPGRFFGGATDIGTRNNTRGVTYVGAPDATGRGRGSRDEPGAGGAGGYTVDFDNAPVAAVAKSIITDTLGLGLTVDPRISGNISLSSGRPLTRNELLLAFESALRSVNASLVKDGTGYRIIPAAETPGAAGIDASRDPTPGFGISVLPLRFVTAENMMKLMEGFSSKPGAVRVDPARNVLIIQGSGEERRVAMETAAAFDQNWMRGQSVGIYPLNNVSPETVINELQRILDTGEGGSYRGILQFQPIARMNAVLAISKQPAALRAAVTWIRRLDRADNSANITRVYRVKYGNATQLARILNQSFGGSGGGGDTNESVEPGAGRVTLASTGTSNQVGRGGAGGAGGTGGIGGLGGAGSQPGQAGQQGGASSPFGALGGGNRAGQPGGQGGQTGFGNGQGGTGGAAPIGGGGGAGGRAGSGGGTVQITAESSTNSLLIFADRERYRMIERVLQELDKPRLQVAIETTIAEVSLNEGLEFGVQYFFQSQVGTVGFTPFAQATQAIAAVLPGYNLLFGPQASARAILSALGTKTNVKVLSNPSVVVLDNQVATIQVGDQVPVATTQATLVGTGSNGSAFPVANNIDYRNTGVILRVLPRVSANGNVTLEVDQEISNVVQNGSQGSLTPTVAQRHVRSTIAVSSDQTVLLGGLISDRQTGGKSGIPILSAIDYLGDLFARKNSARDRTELVIFIRPQVIASSVDAQAVAEQMRSKMLLSSSNPRPIQRANRR